MILPWMLYSCTIAVLLALAAWPLESVVRQRGWPVRGLWSLSLLGSLLLPLLPNLLPRRSLPAAAAPSPSQEVVQTSFQAPLQWIEWAEPLRSVPAPLHSFDLDPWLLALWAISRYLNRNRSRKVRLSA